MDINPNTVMKTRVADLDALKLLAMKAAEMRSIANTTEVHWQEISAGAFDILYSISSLWGKVAPGYVEMDIKRRDAPEVHTMAEKYYRHYYQGLLEDLQTGNHQGGIGKITIDNWISALQAQINQDRGYLINLLRDVQTINDEVFSQIDTMLAVGYYGAATTKVLADLGGILLGVAAPAAMLTLSYTITATAVGFASPIIVDLINDWNNPEREDLILGIEGVTLPKDTQTKATKEFGMSLLGLVSDETLLQQVELNVWKIPREQALRELAQNVNQGVLSHADAASHLGRIKDLGNNMRTFQSASKIASTLGKGLQVFAIGKSVYEYYQAMNAFNK